ncbi:MAG: c-type cytochrome, partial [Nitrospinota bacterium]
MLIDKKEQRYYNIQTLHKFFALSSALLLASIIWIIKDDYSAEWKHWQREFLALEAAHPLKKTLLENSPIFQNKQSGEFPKETSPLKTVIASSIRDLPFLDFLNPSVKIEQTILGDFPFQLHFAEAKRVDRCTSCHVSLTEPRYMQQSNPLRPHPRTDLFVSFDSPHPAASFGCTICHQGRDRGTSFLSSAHSPNSGITATKWKKTYNWEPLDFWPYPMLPSKYIESSCLKCHQKQNFFEGGIKLSKGKKLIKKLGCRGCHRIPGEENFRKPGPSLRRIASKLNKEWVKSWIQNPGEWNKHANMPLFFPPGGPLSEKEISIKIDAIVEFLFHQSEKAPLLPVKKPGTPENGRKLFSAIGCTACHPDPEDEKGVPKDGFPAAPPLKNLKTKVTHEWLFSWLKSPERLDPTTLMPDFRLTDQEAADLTAYLLQSDDNTDPEAVLARDAQLS